MNGKAETARRLKWVTAHGCFVTNGCFKSCHVCVRTNLTLEDRINMDVLWLLVRWSPVRLPFNMFMNRGWTVSNQPLLSTAFGSRPTYRVCCNLRSNRFSQSSFSQAKKCVGLNACSVIIIHKFYLKYFKPTLLYNEIEAQEVTCRSVCAYVCRVSPQ
jgi:hypothetical protein